MYKYKLIIYIYIYVFFLLFACVVRTIAALVLHNDAFLPLYKAPPPFSEWAPLNPWPVSLDWFQNFFFSKTSFFWKISFFFFKKNVTKICFQIFFPVMDSVGLPLRRQPVSYQSIIIIIIIIKIWHQFVARVWWSPHSACGRRGGGRKPAPIPAQRNAGHPDPLLASVILHLFSGRPLTGMSGNRVQDDGGWGGGLGGGV